MVTELVEKAHSAQMRTAFSAHTALNRYASQEEIAGAALLLASEEASCVTSAHLAVDGGFVSSGDIVR